MTSFIIKSSILAVQIVISCFAGALGATTIHAASATDDPAPRLLASINGVIEMVSGHSAEAIDAHVLEIRAKMSETFAIDAIVQRTFGRNWTKFSVAQQAEVVDLLGRIIIRTFASHLATGTQPAIKIVSSRAIGPDRWEIVSAVTQDGKTANVVYRMVMIAGKWMVYDVLAENVSVVGNYRRQFDAHFENKSAEDLLEILRSKVSTKLEGENAKP